MSKSQTNRPNILLLAIDSLLADHMSCYGYHRLTTPHLDRIAAQGTLFERTYSAHIPTTPAYSSMFTGRDCFGMEVVALRHKGGLTPKVMTLAEICKGAGYNTTCVGFQWNPASRGFDKYLEFASWGTVDADGKAPKAQFLNDVAQPEIDRLNQDEKPWFLMLRHMDPHSPYLPPVPFDRAFYSGDERDPANTSMDPVRAFKPFWDYFESWLPKGITDKDYVIAQYDGAIAYMDACIRRIFTQLESLGILDDTIIAINGDHGETLYDHDCFFDHHGLYDVTLHVPLILRYPARVPAGRRISGYNQHKDLVPTLLDLAGIDAGVPFEGRSLMPMIRGEVASHDSEFYITECTWMRKHGWRTPQWKLIVALEPDFHFKPEIELYNLIEDPGENHNVAESNPDIVATLRGRMDAFIARREKQTGITNPMFTAGDWHGHQGVGPFTSSQQAFDTLHIGSVKAAQRLQAREEPKKEEATGKQYADRGEHKPKELPVVSRQLPGVGGSAGLTGNWQPATGNSLLVTVIGRGHSGTRAISHTLSHSCVYMGDTLNKSGDLLPPEPMYEACRVMARHVKYLGNLRWDFSKLHAMPIDPAFTKLIETYLASVLKSPAARKGWKIPETTLVFPWIARMFPEAAYIHWVRDPRDCILGAHLTDNLADFGVPCDPTDDIHKRRAVSWIYQAQLVADTPKPKRWMLVRLEDFILKQDETLARLSDFLGFPLVKIPVKPEVVGRWKADKDHRELDILRPHLAELGYL